jgi:hypothetical protein
MAKKVIAFSIEIDGKKEITEVTQLFGLLETQLLIVNQTLIEINKNASELSGEGLTDISEQLKETGTSANQLTEFFKASFTEFEEGNQVVQDLGNGYFETAEQIDQTSKSISELKDENKDLKEFLESAPLEGTAAYEKISDALDVARDRFAENREAILGFNKELRTGNKESEIAEGSILDLRNRVKELTKEYNALGQEAREGTDGQEVQKNLAGTVADLKKLEEAVGDNRRSVGNYKKAFEGLGGIFGPIRAGINGVSTAFKFLLANPVVAVIGAIVAGFSALIAAFKSTKEGAEAFARASAALGAVLDVIRDVAVTVGSALVSLFSDPVESVKALGAAIKDGFLNVLGGAINLITATGGALKSLLTLDFDGFKESAEAAGNVLVNGFNNAATAANSLTGAISGTTDEIIREAKEAARLTGVLQDLDDTQRDLRVSRAQLNAQLNKTRAASRDENLSIRERIKALNDVKAAEESQLASEITAQTQRVAALKALQKASDTGPEALDEIAAAEINLARLREQSASKEITIQRDLDRLNNKRRSDAEKDRKEEEKRLEQIEKQRAKLREQLENDSLARLNIINQLSAQVIDLEIQNQEDRTQAAIDGENERFKRQTEARKDNLSKLIKQVEAQRKQIEIEFGKDSETEKAFLLKSGAEVRQVKALNNKLEIQQSVEHQKALTKLEKDATEERAKIQAAAVKKVGKGLTTGFSKFFKSTEKVFKKVNEDRKAQNEALGAALVEGANTLLNSISQISAIAAQAEQQQFDDAIQGRQNNIDALNEDLQSATGLQKKFLEQQVEQEVQAQNAIAKQAEKARKEQAEAQKAIAIIQAIIGTAVAVTNALGSAPPPASFILAAAAGVAGAVQIATIAAQKFAQGGIVNGPSHKNGGVPFTVGGRPGFEAEGGEAIINKNSVPFQNGGLLGAPISAPVSPASSGAQQNFDATLAAFNQQTVAINNRIDRIQVVNSVDSFNEKHAIKN